VTSMADTTTPDEIEGLLQAAIEAAKGKQPGEARTLLRRVLTADPDNATAWLWMSGVINDPLKREDCLRKVLDLEPDHAVARRGLARAQQNAANYLLIEGIKAAEAGEKAKAHKLFIDVVMRDEQNSDAWLCLSRVVDNAEDREICYENILTQDPENAMAQDGLELLRQARAAAEERPWDDIESDEDGERIASTLAGDILGDEYRGKYTTEIPEPEPDGEPPSAALWAKYEDPNHCPYCAAPTEPQDKRCPECSNRLWIKYRPNESRSPLLWILILLQIISTLMLAAVPFVTLFIVAFTASIPDATQLLPAYIGLPHTLSEAALRAAHTLFPPMLFWLLWIPFLMGLVMIIGLYLRWRIVFYLMLAGAVLGLIGSIGSLAFAGQSLPGLIGGVVGVGLSFANAVLMIKLEQDFRVQQRVRLTLALDRGPKTGMDYLVRGRAYGANKMWALSAIHFRQAAGLMMADIDGLAGIAQTTAQLGDMDLAQWALENALERRPDNDRVRTALASLLGERE